MFRFSLQPVLDQRIAQEELRQREHQEIQAVMDRLRQEQRSIEEDIEQQGASIREQLGRGMTYQIRNLYESWIDYQKQEVRRLGREMDNLRDELEKRRLRLVEAARGRTLIEKLREKEAKAWRVEQDRLERIAFDELGSRRFSERRRSEKNAARQERNARP